MKSVKDVRRILERRKGKRGELEEQIQTLSKKIKESKRDLRRHEQAREIVREAELKTQESLQYHISDISSLALDAVFEDPYELVVQFVQRRNKSECDLLLKKRGELMKPLDSSGGGVVDVVSNALRIASWSMKIPRSRNTIIMDEPFKHLRGEEENKRVLTMIKEISEKLNLQIIMIGDVKVSKEVMTEAADSLFEMNIKKGISRINQLK